MITRSNREKSRANKLMFQYGFTTVEARIPGMQNYRQELLLILAPEDNYQPHVDPNENSKALGNQKTKKVEWLQNQYHQTKFILPFPKA